MVEHRTAIVIRRAIIEQFNAFEHELVFANTDEELDYAAQQIGCRSAAELRKMALFMLFMHDISQKARWN